MKAFECKMCGQCCYGAGISIDENGVKKISEFLNMDKEEFKNIYCIKKQNRYELKITKANYCIFLIEKDGHRVCSIHPVKPDMCKKWPFIPAIISDKDEWSMVKDFCPGIRADSGFEEFVAQAKEAMDVDENNKKYI